MNAASKAIHQGRFFHGEFRGVNFSKWALIQLFLSVMVLVSALSCVYVVHLHRVYCSQMQAQIQHTHQLELQWGQLLLEQSSLASPARIEKLAAQKLNMVYPNHENTFVLKAE